MEDERLNFLYDNILVLCEVADRKNLQDRLSSAKAVKIFLDDPR